MSTAPRMNRPVSGYNFFLDTLMPRLRAAQEKMQQRLMTPEEMIAGPLATGGLLAVGDTDTRQGVLDQFSMAPGLGGDIAGPIADLHRFANYPEERTLINAGMSGLGLLPFVPSLGAITTWHGSPHKWDAPDISKVGTGEGAQAYGHGFYSAEAPEVAKTYKHVEDKTLLVDGVPLRQAGVSPDAVNIGQFMAITGKSYDDVHSKALKRLETAERWLEKHGELARGKHEKALHDVNIIEEFKGKTLEIGQPEGHLYKLDIPDEDVAKYLDWDKPLSEQPEAVREALRSVDEKLYDDLIIGYENNPNWPENYSGRTFYEVFSKAAYGRQEDAAKASELLHQAGIPGIRYLDGSSRSAGEGTYNYVTFDPSRIKVLERNGKGLLDL